MCGRDHSEEAVTMPGALTLLFALINFAGFAGAFTYFINIPKPYRWLCFSLFFAWRTLFAWIFLPSWPMTLYNLFFVLPVFAAAYIAPYFDIKKNYRVNDEVALTASFLLIMGWGLSVCMDRWRDENTVFFACMGYSVLSIVVFYLLRDRKLSEAMIILGLSISWACDAREIFRVINYYNAVMYAKFWLWITLLCPAEKFNLLNKPFHAMAVLLVCNVLEYFSPLPIPVSKILLFPEAVVIRVLASLSLLLLFGKQTV